MIGVGQPSDDMREAPRFVLSTDDVPAHERFDFYQASLQSMVCPLSMEHDGGADFRGSCVAHPLDAVTLLDFEVHARPVVRRTAADVARGAIDHVFLYQQRGGCGTFLKTAGNADGEMCVGDFMIGHTDEMFESQTKASFRHRVWAIERPLVPLLGGASSKLMKGLRLPGGSAIAAILRAYTDELDKQMDALQPGAVAAFAANLGMLAAIAVNANAGQEAGAPGLAAGQLALVRQQIDRRLANPLLSPARVAQACGISVRKLHALFEREDDSFSSHVMARRLDEARATLANRTLRDRSITDVAFGLGFNSLATFYRNYRIRFGETPGDTRANERGQACSAERPVSTPLTRSG